MNIQERKEKLKRDIIGLCDEFQKETGAYVMDLYTDINQIIHIDDEHCCIKDIVIQVCV